MLLREANEFVFCKECDVRMEKQPTAAGLKFKGAGWTPKHFPKQ